MITDMRMPLGSGLDVPRACNRVRPPRPTTFLMAGQSDDSDLELARAEGALMVLRKPVSLHSILDALSLVERYRLAS